MWCWTSDVISLLVYIDGGEPGILLQIVTWIHPVILPHYGTQTVYHGTRAKQVQYTLTHIHTNISTPPIFPSDSVPSTFLSGLYQRARASEELKVQFPFVSYCTLIFLSHSVTSFIFLSHTPIPHSFCFIVHFLPLWYCSLPTHVHTKVDRSQPDVLPQWIFAPYILPHHFYIQGLSQNKSQVKN